MRKNRALTRGTLPFAKIDEYILDHYQASFMSDAKWIRLFTRLLEEFSSGLAIRYKLIHGDEIHETMFSDVDTQFFMEPIYYKEIEWVEFVSEFEDWANPENRKAGKVIRSQSVKGIADALPSIGRFEIEEGDRSIRIFGYR